MKKFLTLWLEGPLQAWGYDSRFDTRRTLSFPTRSGLTGMLLAAAGASGPQQELLAELAEYPLNVYSFHDNGPALTDFHMVGNGYGSATNWAKLMAPKKLDGSTPVGGGAKLTRRDYLVDRCFAAIWIMPEQPAEKFAAALRNPVYELYLGRKCCVASELIFQGSFPTESEALARVRELAERKKRMPEWVYQEVPEREADSESLLLADVPLRFGLHKLYRERCVNKMVFVF